MEELAPAFDLARRSVCDLGRGDTRRTIEHRLGPPTRFWARRNGQLLRPDRTPVLVDVDEAILGWSILFDGVRDQWKQPRMDGQVGPTQIDSLVLTIP